MKNTIIFLLFALSSYILTAQNFCDAGGAQGDSLGIADCHPYKSSCPEEYNAEILLVLKTDSNAHETSWQIEDLSEGIIVGSGDSLVPDSTYLELICAYTDHCYRFTIFDSEGNGIDTVRNAGYYIFWNGILKNSGGDFVASDTTSFGSCCSDFSVELIGGIPCVNYSEGQVQLITTGGTPPFDYLWSNGATHTEKKSISTDDDRISVLVTDASNCAAADTFYMKDLKSLEIEMIYDPGGFCIANSGKASVSILSGIPPYTFSWSTGGNKQTEQNLAPGTYSVTVADASECQVESNVTIMEPSPIVVTVDSIINATYNNQDGAIYITVTGGSGETYSYKWNNELNTVISEVEDPSGLPAGTYSVTVTDPKGCSVTHTDLVTDIDDITFDNELENLISLIPNPTNGKVLLTLNLHGYHAVQIRVYNNLGKEIIAMPSENIQVESFEMDLSKYSTGVYFFKISVDGRVVTKKLIYSK
jgi:hypothetical protein